MGAGVEISGESTESRTSIYREQKIDVLERHLRDYKTVLQDAMADRPQSHAAVLIDDFYLLPRDSQPDVVDYLHRLLRDTDIYMKVATIRHRTTLARNYPQTIGLVLFQDVEEINLDRTLEDLDGTQAYLGQMLSSMGASVGIPDVAATCFNSEAAQALTLASGGVPRDYLNIFVEAVNAAVADGQTHWLTPKYVYKGAARLAYRTKLRSVSEDAEGDAAGLERLVSDLLAFCIQEKRKTAFLISQEEAQTLPREHDLVQQLMDFKLIHVVEPDTSAASGRTGRYEAYTLDFSLFMEPRRRSIEIVEFWKLDENRRRTGLREAPVYPLARAGRAFVDTTIESGVDAILRDEHDGLSEPRAGHLNDPEGSSGT
jgi:hypothetical protein